MRRRARGAYTREAVRNILLAGAIAALAIQRALVEENAEVLEGFYANTNFTPFETRPKPQGLKLYDKWIKRTGGTRNQNSIVGWINADLFVEGLKAAGPEFTQQKVVGAINQMTDYSAKGLLAGVDWTRAHEKDKACYALVKIVDGKFEIPEFRAKAVQIAKAGIYDLRIHHDEVVLPVLFTHWKIDQVTGLTDEAEQARDGITNYLSMLDAMASHYEEKRAARESV